MKKIFVNGLSALDFIHKVDEIPKNASKYKAIESVISVGGAAHASVAIQRLGGQAYLSSVIGKDEIGQIIRKKLFDENINLEYSISSDTYKSSFSSIFIDKNGERLVVNNRDDHNENFNINFNKITFDGYLFDTRFPDKTMLLLKKIRKINRIKLLDAEKNTNLEMINLCTHVAFSYEGLVDYTNETDIKAALLKIKETSKTEIFVTNGSKGSYYLKDKKLINIPTLRVNVKNTLGAGDVWHGVFIYMLLQNKQIEECLYYSNIAASIKCSKFDNLRSIPYKNEINKHIKNDLFS